VVREGDASADTVRQPIDFYSADTFNYNTLDVSADGKTLTVKTVGINSTAQNAAREYDAATNPAREILSFSIDAFAPPAFTVCPSDATVDSDAGQCSALFNFDASTSGFPAPTVTCTLNGTAISSPFGFPKGVNLVTCTAVNSEGTATCSFSVTVNDTEAPKASCAAVRPFKIFQDPLRKVGEFQLLAPDNCDPDPQIYIGDSRSSFVAGPFHNLDLVEIAAGPSLTPEQHVPDSGPNVAVVFTKDEPLLWAVDSSGNTSTPIKCK